jgi:hypothetical protein
MTASRNYSRMLALVMIGALAAGTWADCGSVPFRSPLSLKRLIELELLPGGQKNVKFDPLDVVVYEPGQRGIVLWNGEEETLLLSTEIRTSVPTSILEVIPFPNEPTVRLGDFSTFEKMQRLVMEKGLWQVASGGGVPNALAIEEAARITFHEKMGAHDIAVVKVQNSDYFLQWVQGFLRDQGATDLRVNPDFVKVIGNYLERGYDWFVFDTIDVGTELGSHEPVEFRFKSDQLYYPLEISTLETGKTKVDLLLVTPSPLKGYGGLTFAVDREKHHELSEVELDNVSPEWAAFMGVPSMTMQQVRIKGDIRAMKTDLLLRD